MTEKHIVARFYQSNTGACPVLEWLRGLPVDDRQAIGQDLARVEFGWPVGMPICRALGNGLWEVRSTLLSRRIARLIFLSGGRSVIRTPWFYKKASKHRHLICAWRRNARRRLNDDQSETNQTPASRPAR